jgi:hypothetical protein
MQGMELLELFQKSLRPKDALRRELIATEERAVLRRWRWKDRHARTQWRAAFWLDLDLARQPSAPEPS